MLKMFRTLAAALLLASGGALAVTPFPPLSTNFGDLSGDSASLSRTFPGGFSFTEVVSFNLSTASFVTALSIFDSNVSSPATVLSFPASRTTFTSPALTTFTDEATLGPGNYTATLSGTVANKPGFYSFVISAVPIPEPAQWMLFAAGVVLVGFMARRRSRL